MHRTNEGARCPCCKRPCDAATQAGGEDGPSPGDWSVCWSCGAALVFGEDLRVRFPAPELEIPAAVDRLRAQVHAELARRELGYRAPRCLVHVFGLNEQRCEICGAPRSA